MGVSEKKRKLEDSDEGLPEKKIKTENGKEEEEKEGKQEDMQVVKKKSKPVDKEPVKRTTVPGVIISIKGIEKGMTREAIKNIFTNFGVSPKYIDLMKEADYAYVRMETASDTQKAVTSMTEAKVAFGNQIPQLLILDGVDEEEYWKKDLCQCTKKQEIDEVQEQEKERKEKLVGFSIFFYWEK